MENQSELQTIHTHDVWSFLGGLLVGGVTGMVTMMLFAPQSGERTRTKIQQKSVELLDQTNDAVDDTMAHIRHKTHQIRSSIRHQTDALQQHGLDILNEQKERLSTLVENSETAL